MWLVLFNISSNNMVIWVYKPDLMGSQELSEGKESVRERGYTPIKFVCHFHGSKECDLTHFVQ